MVPALVEPHGHGTDEGLHTGRGLVVGSAEAAADILVVEHLDLEGEVLLQVLDDHHKEGELDPEGALGVGGAANVRSGDVGSHDLEDRGLDVLVRDPLNMSITDLLVPNLEGLRSARGRVG